MSFFVAAENALAVIQQQEKDWEATLYLEGSQPQCLAQDPFQPEHIYCGTWSQGLWHSLDGGTTWAQTGDGLVGKHIMSVAVSPVDQVGGAGIVYVGTEPSAIYRSDNGGQSWQELAALRALPSAPTWSFPPRPWTSHIRWITPDPLVSGRIFAAAEAGALVRSFDGGQTWEDRKPDGPFDTHTLIMHRQAPNRLYSAAGDGFMRPGNGFVQSDNGGETWHRPNEGLHYNYLWSVAADPADPNTIVISAARGPLQAHNPGMAESVLYRRSGNGNWQQVKDGLPPTQGLLASVLATNEAEPGVFYAASNKGIFRSQDTGITWEELAIQWPGDIQPERVNGLIVAQA